MMEDIINKDIFSDKVLKKYSPDYNSQEIFHRMQIRREIVNDSNTNSIRIGNSYKKNIRKTKDSYRFKKDLVKLRAYYQNMNLKNQTLLKDRKCQEKCTSKLQKNILIKDDRALEKEIFFAPNYLEENKDLVVESNSDFKVIQKEKSNLKSTIEKTTKENEYKNRISNLNTKAEEEEFVTCGADLGNDEGKEIINEYKKDLKSLLIMMTINKNTDDNTECDIETPLTDRNSICQDIDDHYKSELTDTELNKILHITPAVKNIRQRQKFLIHKYLALWKIYVNKRKEDRLYEQRRDTFNLFFEKLAKKKSNNNNNEAASESVQRAKTLARDYNTYQHRYKVQKHVIALQKAKLEEQNKLIEQLKYNKIVDATQQSMNNMKEDIRKTYYEIDKHLKPKIKNLTNELKIREFEEPSLILHCLKVPQFLQRMESRAREREEKHALIRERRQQMEEERIRLKQQAELTKMEMDKEEKSKRMKELKEKRKKEKIENIRKKQHAERMRALIVMADLHYERNLMAKYGIRPLRRLMEIKQDNLEKAKSHYRFQLLKNIFLHWMWHTEDMWFERNYKAEEFHRKKILQKTFDGFKTNYHEYILKKQVAEDYFDLYVTHLVFQKFKDCIKIIQYENELKWKKAVVYYNSNILFKTFTCWRTLPALNALKREQEVRKLRWREKVLLVVPDYNPPDD